ncbi:MAG TPA: TIGR03560 family F420-dependent LLM class oxidoreductase [Ktedonobacteraceae bacterium]|nr:TIGR03560 family F420-dependent LLM class oxidoreductase [Ktedonobacteraceae bacterium]
MVAISLMIEGQTGVTWPHWKRLVAEVEDLGFAGMFRSDHFTSARPPDKASLETIVSLTYLADHTRRIHFGPLVAPFSFRNPVFLARQGAAIDDLSNGRMILGLGAGWQEREHQAFGFDLGDLPTRMQRFQEGLEVVTRLLKSNEPVSYQGSFYQLHEAMLLPRPQRPGGPRILLGGNGPRRTLPLAALYADIWNAVSLTPGEFRERSELLDKLLVEAGRKPEDVQRTLMRAVFFGRDRAELERRLRPFTNQPDYAGKSIDDIVHSMTTQHHEIAGTADMIIEQIKTYEGAGVAELMLQWFDFEDIDGLRAFAASVLPHV